MPAFTSIALGAAAATGIAGSAMQAGAMGDAADQQAAASMHATNIQKEMFDQQRKDLEPWRQTGMRALSNLEDPYFSQTFNRGWMENDDGYQFRMDEGQKALERSAAARGGRHSAGTMKALTRYGQDFASNEYSNAYNRFNADRDRRFNRLSSLAGVGQTANSQIAAAGQNYANQAGQNAMSAANAQAAAQVGQANIWGNTIGGLGKSWMDYSLYKSMMPSTTSGGGSPVTSLGSPYGAYAVRG